MSKYIEIEIKVRVQKLGNFVEVEFKGGGSKADPRKITDRMVQFLKDKGCVKITRNYQGYPFLLLFPAEAKYEEQ